MLYYFTLVTRNDGQPLLRFVRESKATELKFGLKSVASGDTVIAVVLNNDVVPARLEAPSSLQQDGRI